MDVSVLRQYLLANQRHLKEPQAHRFLLDEIKSSLPFFSIPQPFEVFREVDLIKGKQEIGRVDFALLSSEQLYLIEGKVIYNYSNPKRVKKTKTALRSQLEKSHSFFTSFFRVNPICIFVYKKGPTGRLEHYSPFPPINSSIEQ